MITGMFCFRLFVIAARPHYQYPSAGTNAWQVKLTMDKGLEKAIEAAGGIRALARALGISHQAILQWRRVPAERVVEVEEVTGVPREILRRDLYRAKVPA